MQILHLRKNRIFTGILKMSEHFVSFYVLLSEPNFFLVTASLPQVLHAHLVHGKESHGGTVLGTHVCDGRPVCNRQLRQSRAEEFHELPNNSDLSEMLRDGQDDIRRRDQAAELTC